MILAHLQSIDTKGDRSLHSGSDCTSMEDDQSPRVITRPPRTHQRHNRPQWVNHTLDHCR